jgi:hypothetical protein
MKNIYSLVEILFLLRILSVVVNYLLKITIENYYHRHYVIS